MLESNNRYAGPATVRRSYMTEFVVECPKCQGAATITSDNPYFLASAKLTCDSCKHFERAEDLIQYRVSVLRHCDNCGQYSEKVIPNSKDKIENLACTCPRCGVSRSFKPHNEEFVGAYTDQTTGHDPIFRLPLWLQADIKGNLFWAYNRVHLDHIRQYVVAKLRERQTNTHTTMVERLPGFLKEAKNRTAILKVIDRLLQK